MKRYLSLPFVFLLGVIFATTACGGVAAPTTAAPVVEAATNTPVPPSPTATALPPTEEPPTAMPPTAKLAEVATPTTVPPTPTAEIAAVDWLTVQGRTEDGLPTLGNPDAAVRVIDYSDFL